MADPTRAAPLLCAGITTYSPLRQWNTKKGDRVGVVGLGGLGTGSSSTSGVRSLATSSASRTPRERTGMRTSRLQGCPRRPARR